VGKFGWSLTRRSRRDDRRNMYRRSNWTRLARRLDRPMSRSRRSTVEIRRVPAHEDEVASDSGGFPDLRSHLAARANLPIARTEGQVLSHRQVAVHNVVLQARTLMNPTFSYCVNPSTLAEGSKGTRHGVNSNLSKTCYCNPKRLKETTRTRSLKELAEMSYRTIKPMSPHICC
jgi:hypothetical protein